MPSFGAIALVFPLFLHWCGSGVAALYHPKTAGPIAVHQFLDLNQCLPQGNQLTSLHDRQATLSPGSTYPLVKKWKTVVTKDIREVTDEYKKQANSHQLVILPKPTESGLEDDETEVEVVCDDALVNHRYGNSEQDADHILELQVVTHAINECYKLKESDDGTELPARVPKEVIVDIKSLVNSADNLVNILKVVNKRKGQWFEKGAELKSNRVDLLLKDVLMKTKDNGIIKAREVDDYLAQAPISCAKDKDGRGKTELRWLERLRRTGL